VSALLNRPWVRFARHYVEMVVVMVVGMTVLDVPFGLVVDVSNRPAAMLVEMTVTMTVPMVAWMRLRGNAWRPCNEMAASMILPALATLGLLGADVVTGSGSSMVVLHALMLPSMLFAMLVRRSEYSCAHGHHRAVEAVAA
jgi:flagellar biosynthetic protein FliP